jgi:hypothetical protein
MVAKKTATGKSKARKLKVKKQTIRDLQVRDKIKGGCAGQSKVNCGGVLPRASSLLVGFLRLGSSRGSADRAIGSTP